MLLLRFISGKHNVRISEEKKTDGYSLMEQPVHGVGRVEAMHLSNAVVQRRASRCEYVSLCSCVFLSVWLRVSLLVSVRMRIQTWNGDFIDDYTSDRKGLPRMRVRVCACEKCRGLNGNE